MKWVKRQKDKKVRKRNEVFQERRKRKTRQQSRVWTSRRGHDVPGILSNVALFRRGFTVQLTFRQLLLRVWRFIGSRSSFTSNLQQLLFFSLAIISSMVRLSIFFSLSFFFFFIIFYPQQSNPLDYNIIHFSFNDLLPGYYRFVEI